MRALLGGIAAMALVLAVLQPSQAAGGRQVVFVPLVQQPERGSFPVPSPTSRGYPAPAYPAPATETPTPFIVPTAAPPTATPVAPPATPQPLVSRTCTVWIDGFDARALFTGPDAPTGCAAFVSSMTTLVNSLGTRAVCFYLDFGTGLLAAVAGNLCPRVVGAIIGATNLIGLQWAPGQYTAGSAVCPTRVYRGNTVVVMDTGYQIIGNVMCLTLDWVQSGLSLDQFSRQRAAEAERRSASGG